MLVVLVVAGTNGKTTLLKALKPTTRILLVGDSNQLPSVGAGIVLRDLILSELIPTTQLPTIYGQQYESPIIYAAEEVLSGKVPALHQFKELSSWMDVADCVGDRMIQLVNRYDTTPAVMNGESGWVVAVDAQQKRVTVEFEGGACVDYLPGNFDQIAHAYCLTCHKSQGSEFQYVMWSEPRKTGKVCYHCQPIA